METSPLLLDIGVVIIIATILAYFARLLKQPLLVAYVLAGIIIGPMVLGIITNPEEILILAELGIAFLLFTVGLEIDFERLRSAGVASIIGGSIQMIITFLLGFGIAVAIGLGSLIGAYIGLLLAFSSTMIVAKLLVDRNEIKTVHGRIMMGVLLIQDLLVILVLPMLANVGGIFSPEVIALIILKGLGIFSIAVVMNKYVLSRVLDYAAKSNEVLFLTAIAVCFTFIGLSYALDFPIAIGAFLGGIALSRFPYTMEIFGEMHRLRDFFSVIFFTSLGMQLNLMVIAGMFPLFLLLIVVTILAKPLILSAVYLVMGYGGRTASTIGIGMGQASEFAFILAAQGLLLGHLSAGLYSMMVSVVVITMMMTPYLMNSKNRIYHLFTFQNLGFFKHIGAPKHIKKHENHPTKQLKDHVIVFGADMMGGKIVNHLAHKKRNFIVAEHNPEVIKDLSKKGIYTIYGDADNEDLLRETGLYRAKLAIVTIPSVKISAHEIGKAKRFNPKIKVFARAHSEHEADALYRVGADFVVVPDFVSGGTLIRKTEHFLSGGRSDELFKHLNGRGPAPEKN